MAKYNSYSREIVKLIPNNSHVLDIGCTTGKLAQQIQKKGCTVIGIDIDEKSLKQAAKYCQRVINIDVDNFSLLNKELKNEVFDCITCGDILEHLKSPKKLLHMLRKFLKPNGVIIASIPNSAFIWMRIRFLIGNFSYSEKGGLMDEDHLRFYSFHTAELLFTSCDYNIKKIMASNEGISDSRYYIIKLLAKIFPRLFALHIIILADKNEGN